MSGEIKRLIHKFDRVLEKFPEVKYAGEPILGQVCKDVSLEEGMEIGNKLGKVLMRYRKAVGYGRGFAAPQIGIKKAVFVTFVDDKLDIFMNPRIIGRSKKTNFYRELCLSSGVFYADVERPRWIKMKWLGVDGNQSQKFGGFFARLYQHEVDHLKGVINLDRAKKGDIGFATFNPLEEKLRNTRN